MTQPRAILIPGTLAALLLLVTVGWTAVGLDRTADGMLAAEVGDYARAVASYEVSEAGLQQFVADYPDLEWAAWGYPHRHSAVLVESGPGPTLHELRPGPVRPGPQGTFIGMMPPPRPAAERVLASGLVLEGPPPLILVQFRPTLAAAIHTRARVSFVIALLASLLLVGVSVGLARAQQHADEAKKALADAQHLAQMGEMSAVLAHEIKNPLASLKGHAQLLEELLADTPHVRRARRVVNEAVRLQELIDALLAYARKAELKVRTVEVDALLAEVAGDRDQVRIAAPAGLEWPLDRALVQRSVANLVTNALQAGGDAPVEVTATAGAQLTIEVRDRGPGLQGQTPEELFAPFSTTRTRGTGLGLAIAMRVAHAHGGSIRAADHPDGGAVFTLVLGVPNGSNPGRG